MFIRFSKFIFLVSSISFSPINSFGWCTQIEYELLGTGFVQKTNYGDWIDQWGRRDSDYFCS